jgi:CheY-like chemotaxis protein
MGQHHAQAPAAAVQGLGHHAVDHLLLQHEMLVFNGRHMVEQMKQDRGGDVVGRLPTIL